MGAICPKPKKDDNAEEDYKEFLNKITTEICKDNEQCKRKVIGDDALTIAERVLEEKKKSEKNPEDPENPEDPKKLRFN